MSMFVSSRQEATQKALIMLYGALDDPDYNLLLRTASAKPGEVVGAALEEGQSGTEAMDQWYCWHLVIIPHGKSEQWAGIKGCAWHSPVAPHTSRTACLVSRYCSVFSRNSTRR